MKKAVEKLWNNYKYRFVPWIMLNAKHGPRDKYRKKDLELETNEAEVNSKEMELFDHVSHLEDTRMSDSHLRDLLVNFFEKCHYPTRTNILNDFETASLKNVKIMKDVFGFTLKRRKSTVSVEAGTGVFVESGFVKTGSLVGLYPGTIYMPFEPLFFPSLGNPYIFRCSDGVHIDGNDGWISKSIFKSCSSRDRFNFYTPSCDISWLTRFPVNPLSIGQYVNNRSRRKENNVVYQEGLLTIPGQLSEFSDEHRLFPINFMKFLPNVWSDPQNNRFGLRLITLVAVRDIQKGEEILSSYFTALYDKKEKVIN